MGSIETIVCNGHHSIIDIRSDVTGIELQHEIKAGLTPAEGNEKTLPTLLLYNDQGLKLFERITYLEEYYLTGEELAVLEKHAVNIAKQIPDNSMVLELGSGNLRKIKILLDALEQSAKHVSYYALDVMESELARTLAQAPQYKYIECFGLYGTYNDALQWLKKPEIAAKSKIVMSMGSSIGNFSRTGAADFLKRFAGTLGVQDALLVGLDACQEHDKVYRAYNDSKGITHKFILNGLAHANELLGYEAFHCSDWEIIGEYDINDGAHRAFVLPKKDVVVDGITIKQGEKVRIEESYKYSTTQADQLWRSSNVVEVAKWSNEADDYALHMLKPTAMFPTKPEEYATHPVPSLEEWRQLWKAWDSVSRQMIPENELLSKPIKLRNACIFYLGHIPTFLDIKLTEATGTPPTEPSYFYKIFERGIDPDVDNPEKCHAHSEIPDTWPELQIMLTFQRDVRQRVTNLYTSGEVYTNNWTGRAVWLGYEHEAMHLETLLYMLLQSEWIQPPSGFLKPDFIQLAKDAQQAAVENEWFDIPAQTVTIGLDDPDTPDGPIRHFGWDVEKPVRSVTVEAFKAKARPITNREYAQYMSITGIRQIPASWTIVNTLNDGHAANGVNIGADEIENFAHGKAVRTVYGPVPLKYAMDWPVSASYDELAGCAAYMGGRIPTMEEARSIYLYVEALKKKEATKALGKTIPAVNGHLVNEGVEESPPSKSFVQTSNATSGHMSNDLFVNLDGMNIGFKHWHPMPVTQNGKKLGGQGDMGGLWEWTSSVLEKQEGFVPMKLYPGYSDDFYDGKHNIVLGGSWATIPRIAGRTTFVNWYQRNYPYVWAGARLVKDA